MPSGNAAQATNLYNYDDQSRLTNTTFADGSLLKYSYDALGRVTSVSDAVNGINKYYDNLNRLTVVSNAYGVVWQEVYDVNDRTIQTTDANNVTVNNSFDGFDRVVARVWAADGFGENYVYATNGLVYYTNRDNQATQYGRDAAMRKISETNALLKVTQFGYDGADDVTNLVDALSHKTSWTFNQYGWLTSKLDNNGNTIISYNYDADGRLTNRWMIGTNNTEYAYDHIRKSRRISPIPMPNRRRSPMRDRCAQPPQQHERLGGHDDPHLHGRRATVDRRRRPATAGPTTPSATTIRRATVSASM